MKEKFKQNLEWKIEVGIARLFSTSSYIYIYIYIYHVKLLILTNVSRYNFKLLEWINEFNYVDDIIRCYIINFTIYKS